MSVVIAYSTSALSLIATDTRITYGRTMGLPHCHYTDDNEKLHLLTNMGWAAGVGVGDFLAQLKYALQKNNSEHRDVFVLKTIFRQVYEDFYRDWPYEKDDVRFSGLCASWTGFDPDISQIFFRIGIFSDGSVLDTQMEIARNDQFFLLWPYDYFIAETKREEFCGLHETDFQYDDNLEELLLKTFTMFKTISNTSNSVSNICDVGITMLYDNMPHRLRFTGLVDELIQAAQEGNLSDWMDWVPISIS